MSSYRGRHRPGIDASCADARPGRHRAQHARRTTIALPTGIVLGAAGAAAAVGLIATAVGGATAIDGSPAISQHSVTGVGPAAAHSAPRSANPSSALARPAARRLPGAVSRSSDRVVLDRARRPESDRSAWSCAVVSCHGPMLSGYGARRSPGGIGSTYHRGDDYAVAWGTPLHAMHDGKVVSTGWVPGLGIHVTIDYGHGEAAVGETGDVAGRGEPGNGASRGVTRDAEVTGDGEVQSVYGHMSRVLVHPGQRVRRGQLVGRSGNTGNSTGPHLHLEIHRHGKAVNPAPWLRAHGLR